MPVYFVDSSALVKRYINEISSAWGLNLFNPALNSEILIAAITNVEIIAAITRRMRNGNASEKEARYVCNLFKNDLISEYQIVEITENIISSAMALAEKYKLRGYDAVELAAGCAVNALCAANSLPFVIFVSADNELNKAAVSEGLIVENPNNYS